MTPGRGADALGPHLDLGRRLLAADEHDRAVAAGGADRVEHLQQQRGLADAGLAADEHERARARCRRRARGRARGCRWRSARRPTRRSRRGAARRRSRRRARQRRRRAGAAVPPPPAATLFRRSSVKEFQAPQSGQRPSQRASWWPHWPQVKTTWSLRTTPADGPGSALAGDFGERGLAVAGRRRRVVGRRPDEGFVDAEQ